MAEEKSARLPTVLFGLLLALCVVLALAFVIEEPFEDVPSATGGVARVAVGHGTTHDRFSSLDHGGPGADRRGPVWWLGLSFGLLQLGLIMGCLALPVKRLEQVRAPLVISGLVLAAIFVVMAVTYRGYAGDATPPLLLALPIPTAWFLYAFWPAQFLVVALYVLVYERSIVTNEDMTRFREIVDTHRRRAGR